MGEGNRAWQRKGIKGKNKRGGQLDTRQHVFGSSRKKGNPDTADYCYHKKRGKFRSFGVFIPWQNKQTRLLVLHCPGFIICGIDAWICLKEYRIYVRMHFTTV